MTINPSIQTYLPTNKPLPWHPKSQSSNHNLNVMYIYNRLSRYNHWGFTTHTHKTLFLAMLTTFTPNSNPNQPSFYLSDLSSFNFSFYILFYLDPWFTLILRSSDLPLPWPSYKFPETWSFPYHLTSISSSISSWPSESLLWTSGWCSSTNTLT